MNPQTPSLPQQQQQQKQQQQQQRASSSPAAAAARPEDDLERAKDDLRLLRMRELQWRHLRAKAALAHEARRSKGERALAGVAAAVVDLRGAVAALEAEAGRAEWEEAMTSGLERQLPLLQAWKVQQDATSRALSALRSSLRAALSRLPLTGGATAGPDAGAPDVSALQVALQRASDAAARTRPALARLLGAPGPERQQGAARGLPAELDATTSGGVGAVKAPVGRGEGVVTTAAFARELMSVAADGLRLLEAVQPRLELLSDGALYANSMEVQLDQMIR